MFRKCVMAMAVLAGVGWGGSAARAEEEEADRFRDSRYGPASRYDTRDYGRDWMNWAYQMWGPGRGDSRYGPSGFSVGRGSPWSWDMRARDYGRDYRSPSPAPAARRDAPTDRFRELDIRLDRLQRELDEIRRELRRR